MNNGKVCVSVCTEDAEEMIAEIKRAEPLADVIEVRFDCLQPEQLRTRQSIIRSTTKPIISTFRPKDQGGRRDISRSDRASFWKSQCESSYCDVEEECVSESENAGAEQRICSFHNLSSTPEELAGTFRRLAERSTDIIKIAIQAQDVTDGIQVWQLFEQARSYGKRLIPIAMGEPGKWTRILGLAHGAYLTYGSLEAGKETAEGQISAADLVNIYRVKELDERTKVYGVIGDPVCDSLSPYLQNPAFVEAGINAVFIPLLVKDLDAFMTRMVLPATREVELNFAGFAVTMPHKREVMKYLDEIEETAEKIGAVNTIELGAEGKLKGFNTDAHGFVTPLKQVVGDLHGARVAVLGSGGASRACLYALALEGADVTVFGRDQNKAESIAVTFGAAASPFSELKDQSSTTGVDLIVNATPLGMAGPSHHATPLTSGDMKGVRLVFDLVTSLTDTPLIREAKKAHVATITGVEMLIAQGARQFEIWTGRKPPIETMRTSVLKHFNNGS